MYSNRNNPSPSSIPFSLFSIVHLPNLHSHQISIALTIKISLSLTQSLHHPLNLSITHLIAPSLTQPLSLSRL